MDNGRKTERKKKLKLDTCREREEAKLFPIKETIYFLQLLSNKYRSQEYKC